MFASEPDPKESAALVMRVLASARIGVRPQAQDVEACVHALHSLRRAFFAAHQPDLRLDLARSALAFLQHGYLPAKKTCIDAIQDLLELQSSTWLRGREAESDHDMAAV